MSDEEEPDDGDYEGRPWDDPERAGWYSDPENLRAVRARAYHDVEAYATVLEDLAADLRSAISVGHEAVDGEAVLITNEMYQEMAAFSSAAFNAAVKGKPFRPQRRGTFRPVPGSYYVDIGKTCEWCHAPWGVLCATDSGWYATQEHESRRIYNVPESANEETP
jgi:hypothetical protein